MTTTQKIGIAALGSAIIYFATKKKKSTVADIKVPAIIGPKELSDAEAKLYLQQNSDLMAEGFNLEKAKWHWMNYGFYENRLTPYISTQQTK